MKYVLILRILNKIFEASSYHSLFVDKKSLSIELVITAETQELEVISEFTAMV